MARASPHAVTAEQHAQIKDQIRSHLKSNGVLGELKSIVASALGQKDAEVDSAGDGLSAVTAAQRANVLARIVSDQAGSGSPSVKIPPGQHLRSHLHVLLLGGRAFAHDDDEEPVDPDTARSTVSVCLQFGGQRFRSRAVPFCAEPQLRDGVLLELPTPASGSAAVSPLDALRALAQRCEPMHVLLLRQSEGRETLISSCLLEWRHVLHHGLHTLSLELPGLGTQTTMPVGALEFKLELLPMPAVEARLTEAEAMLALKREREAQLETERRFFAYARAWWAQYLEMSPQHKTRPVKLFALSELGT